MRQEDSKGPIHTCLGIQNESADKDELRLLKQPLGFAPEMAFNELLCRRLPRRSPADKFVRSHTT